MLNKKYRMAGERERLQMEFVTQLFKISSGHSYYNSSVGLVFITFEVQCLYFKDHFLSIPSSVK